MENHFLIANISAYNQSLSSFELPILYLQTQKDSNKYQKELFEKKQKPFIPSYRATEFITLALSGSFYYFCCCFALTYWILWLHIGNRVLLQMARNERPCSYVAGSSDLFVRGSAFALPIRLLDMQCCSSIHCTGMWVPMLPVARMENVARTVYCGSLTPCHMN